MSTEGKMPLSEASEMLTLGEIGLIEKHFGTDFGDGMSPVSMMAGVIWAMERRAPVVKGQPRFDWTAVTNMTVREAEAYFGPEPVEVDEDDPETEPGKDATPDA